jgi:hypothetical protein
MDFNDLKKCKLQSRPGRFIWAVGGISGFLEVFHTWQISEVGILRPEGGMVNLGCCENHAIGHG